MSDPVYRLIVRIFQTKKFPKNFGIWPAAQTDGQFCGRSLRRPATLAARLQPVIKRSAFFGRINGRPSQAAKNWPPANTNLLDNIWLFLLKLFIAIYSSVGSRLIFFLQSTCYPQSVDWSRLEKKVSRLKICVI